MLASAPAITLRPLEAPDSEALRRLFFRLSPETVYRRFFSPMRAPSDANLRFLAGVDHDRRQAIAAVVDGEIIGVARYDRRADDPSRAEMAVVVEDAWQGRGVGTTLLEAVTADAVDHGVTTFTATVLADNRPMLALVRKLARDRVRSRLASGEVELEVPLVSTSAPAA